MDYPFFAEHPLECLRISVFAYLRLTDDYAALADPGPDLEGDVMEHPALACVVRPHHDDHTPALGVQAVFRH